MFEIEMVLSLNVVRSLIRRQVDGQHCNVIEGFDCKCSYYRLTCTNDQDLSTPLIINSNEKGKYQSVELVLNGRRDVQVTDRTFEPIKELFRTDGENLEFRIKFEKFLGLHLSSSSIFNRVFPDNLPSHIKKHLSLEIYNPDVQPNDHISLFENLNVDSLELYGLYPFRGTFQQLFNGANIKYLRLSGGEIRSDMSQSFNGNIAKLELAKQANSLSIQNFPFYPAHELIINAFYINDFNNENPPNYSNLVELRVHSPERIPPNAFKQYPNIQTLTVSTDKDIDPQAFNGLKNLEKLTIKDTKPSIELLNNIPNLKEFETNIDKLDEKSQCQFIEKLANGQIVIQGIPNGRECTCISAYLDSTMGRTPCYASNCDQSSCHVIKNNYDSSTNTFRQPPSIQRKDGSDAFRPKEQKVYSTPFQISNQDQDKLRQQNIYQPNQHQNDYPYQRQSDPSQQQSEQSGQDSIDRDDDDDNRQDVESTTIITENSNNNDQQKSDNDGNDQQSNNDNQQINSESSTNVDNTNNNTETDSSTTTKKGMSWLPIIIIGATIAGLLLAGLIFLLLRKRRSNKGYTATSTNQPQTA